MSELIISVSGLRGIVGESLTPEIAARYAASFVASLPSGIRGDSPSGIRGDSPGGIRGTSPIVVGRDGRTTGPMLRHAIIAAILASGRDVIDADVIATPSIGVLVKTVGAAGGIQISASHNPPPYNGIKLFDATGRVLPAVAGTLVRETYQTQPVNYCSFDRVGKTLSIDDPHAPHLEKVLSTIDVAAVQKRNFRVLIDSNHGAGGMLGTRLLTQLNCHVEPVGIEPTGHFAHVPEPTADNLLSVQSLVTRSKSAVGFCQDPDADRLALIDETGRYIGEECTLALCVRWAIESGRTGGPIVINGATSSMSAQIAASQGWQTHRSSVGEANVVDRMIETDAVYGGEGNGGPIDPRVGFVRDSFVGMAQILDLMARTGLPLSKLADELPHAAIIKEKATLDTSRLPELIDRLIAHFPDATAQTGDGLRLAWPDRWLLVRGSNTEPIVRFIAEAATSADAKKLCQAAMAFAMPAP